MTVALLRTRRFLPLFATQALGALNDNLFKNALVVLVVFGASADGGGSTALVALAGGLFILPYALFSALAGQLADRFDKARLIRAVKLFEVALMAAGAAGLLAGHLGLLFAVLFGLGVHSAFFGPLKYAILPDHLAADELLRGNALVEAGTFGAILAGTVAGGVLIGLPSGPAIVAAAGLLVAVLGAVAGFLVPPTRPAAPGLRIGWNIAAETLSLLRAARANRAVWLSALGLSWFWTLGAVFLAEFPVLARQEFGADNRVVTLLLAGFAVGVGAGSILAGRLLRGAVSARHVPAAAVLLSACTLGFAALAGQGWAAGWTTPAAMLGTWPGIAALACLLGAAACGGVFSVPLYAMLQHRADPASRSRMVAANNVLNAAAMVLGAVVIAALAAAGMRPAAVLGLAAGLNLLVAAAAHRVAGSLDPGTAVTGAQ